VTADKDRQKNIDLSHTTTRRVGGGKKTATKAAKATKAGKVTKAAKKSARGK